tara:strand:+ start:401 stop:2152 length:1752 start_codon:yes stop_codon:yes gene_type:complete
MSTPGNKSLFRTLQSFLYGNKGLSDSEGFDLHSPMPTGYEYLTGIVVDHLAGNPRTYLRKKLVQQPNFAESVKNAHMLNKTPPNSIIVKLIDRGEALNSDSVHVALPFFSPHLAMPIKPGEYVWILKESDAGNEKYYWVSRKHGIDQVDDVNYTFLERSDIIESKIEQKIKERSIGKQKKSMLSNPLAEDSEILKCHSYLPGQIDEINFTDAIYTNRAIVKNTIDFNDRFSYDIVPKLSKNPGDLLLQGSNNTFVQLTTEKFKNDNHTAVLKNEPAIDICIGRKESSINSIEEKITQPGINKIFNADSEASNISAVASLMGTDSEPVHEINKVASLFKDIDNEKDYYDQSATDCAGRIYMSKNCNIDDLFNSNFNVLDSKAGPSIVTYSNHNRVIGEKTVRLANLTGESFLNMDPEGNVVIKSSIEDGQQFLSLANTGTSRLQARDYIHLSVRSDNTVPSEPYVLYSELRDLLDKMTGDISFINLLLEQVLMRGVLGPLTATATVTMMDTFDQLREQASQSGGVEIEIPQGKDDAGNELPPEIITVSTTFLGGNITTEKMEEWGEILNTKMKSTKIFGEANDE